MPSPQELVFYDEHGLLISQSRIVLPDGMTYSASAVIGVRLVRDSTITGKGWAAMVLTPIPFLATCGGGISGFIGDDKHPVLGAFLLLISVALLAVCIWGYKNQREKNDVILSFAGRTHTIQFGEDEERAGRVVEAIREVLVANGSTAKP